MLLKEYRMLSKMICYSTYLLTNVSARDCTTWGKQHEPRKLFLFGYTVYRVLKTTLL